MMLTIWVGGPKVLPVQPPTPEAEIEQAVRRVIREVTGEEPGAVIVVTHNTEDPFVAVAMNRKRAYRPLGVQGQLAEIKKWIRDCRAGNRRSFQFSISEGLLEDLRTDRHPNQQDDPKEAIKECKSQAVELQRTIDRLERGIKDIYP